MKKIKRINLLSAFALIISVSVLFIPSVNAEDMIDINRMLYPSAAKTISMDFKNAPLNDVLKIFSQQSGLNFISSSGIADKTVNLYLDKVPVEEALERILSANNLTYELQGGSNIFVVKEVKKPEKDLITRVYQLKHATVPSSKLRKTLSASEEEDTSSSTTTTSTETLASSTGIIFAIKSLLTADGLIIEDTRTNSLIVTDIASVFPMVEQTIARLDVKIPQILIEVEMLDISKKTADLMGAKWGATPITFKGAQRDTLFPFNTDNLVDHGGIKLTDPYRVATLSFAGLTYDLQFLRTQTDTKNLARPRILTLNNETAEIRIKTNEAIGLASSTTTSEGASASVQEAERVETGIFLKVTPQANIQTNEITMAIEPKVIQATTGKSFGGQDFKDPEERGSKSILRIKDNDTIIIGGLLRTDVQETRTRVPFFGDIPFLGAAFRHKDKTETERELVIFITPHIVQENREGVAETRESPIISKATNIATDKRLEEMERELSLIEGQRF